MKVLILGSGGREHALAWKIKQSPKLTDLFIAPGNAGTATLGTNLEFGVNDFDAIKKAVLQHQINMVIVGPEDPLVGGISDYFSNDTELKNVAVIGPPKNAAQLEGSKDFAKRFMQKHNIPTAAYKTFGRNDLEAGFKFLDGLDAPYVLKADGLAAGKGVIISENLEEAKSELKAMLDDAKFGAASAQVVIEEFLDGIELSVFVLTDGKSYKILPEAKDYKRIGEGDTGLNTGGMGSISPVPFADKDFMQKIEDRIIKPTVNGLVSDGLDYNGFIFFGLIKVKGEPVVIEYNVRMGDPEAESVIPRIKSDLLDLFMGIADRNIEPKACEFDQRHAAAIMQVAAGYPESYPKGDKISGLADVSESIVFHAGTKLDESGDILTNGGRVLAITSFGNSMKEALSQSYKNAEKINFNGKNYRRDLGKDLLKFINE
jgi:phosphoribosylamine--glycine ligase